MATIPFLTNTSFSANVTVASTLTVGGNIQGNGGIKIVGPASHNTIQSANSYVLGLNDQNGVNQWWLNAYTDGDFAIHENLVADQLTIKAGGNVGIGTTSPLTKLHIAGTTDANIIRIENTVTSLSLGSTIGAIQFFNNDPTDNSPNVAASIYATAGASGGSGSLRFKTTEPGTEGDPATDTMIITNGGNVGIGMTSPTTRLNTMVTANTDKMVLGAASGGFKVGNTTGNEYGINMGVSNSGASWIQVGRTDGTATAYNLSLQASGGNVAIGSTSASAKLEVTTASTTSTVVINNSDTQYSLIQFNALGATKGFSGYNSGFMLFGGETGVTTRLQSGGSYAATILTNGNFGIGQTSPSEKLVVAGKVIIENANVPNNLAQLNIGYTGTGETRAIDIDGSWSAGESKSITFTYGSSYTNIVGQMNCVLVNGTDTRLRFGKLYHNGDSSTYTMELRSTSTTTANLTVSGKAISFSTVAADIATTLATKDYVDAHGGGVGPFLPINNPTFTGTLTGPTASITGNLTMGGTIFASNNSPAYSFGSDTNTGIARTGTHQMSFLNNNSVSLNLDAAARAQFYNAVTINGSNAPFTGSELDVRGDIVLIDQNWALRGNNANADFCIEELGSSYSDANIKLVVKSGGNVGIGLASPDTLLHLKSTGPVITLQRDNNGNAAGAINFEGSDGVLDWQIATNFVVGLGFEFNYAGSNKVYIDTDGVVGIGTTNPSGSLAAGGLDVTDRIAVGSGSVGTPALHYRDDTDTGIFFGTGIIAFSGGGVERMRIAPDGDSSFAKISAKAGTYNSSAFLSLYGTNSSTFGGSVVSRATILAATDGTAFGTNLKFFTNNTSNAETVALTIDASQDIQFNAYGAGILISDASGNITTYGGTTPPSGVGAAGRVAIWDNGTEIGSDTNLNWDFSNNRLGIRTTSPNYILDISNDPTGIVSLGLNGSRGAADNKVIANIPIWNRANGVGDIQVAGLEILNGITSNQTQKGQFVFKTNDGSSLAERMRINSVGHVGIGTDIPSTYDGESNNLVVFEGVDGTVPTPGITIACGGNQASSGRGALRFADGTSPVQDSFRGAVEYDHSDNSMNFRTNTQERITIDVNGLAYFKSSSDYKIGLNDSDQVNQWWLKAYTSGTFAIHKNGSGDKLTILSGGNVGIGTTGPTSKLQVNYSAAPSFNANSGANALTLVRDDSGGDLNELGAGLVFAQRYINTATATIGVGGIYGVKTISSGSFGGGLAFYTQPFGSGNMNESMLINHVGKVKLGQYSGTSQTGTPTFLLGTDASGNIVKTNTVPGSGAGPYLPLSAGSSFPLTGDLFTGVHSITTRRLNISSFTSGAGLVMNYGSSVGTVQFINLTSNGVIAPIKLQMRQSPNESDLILAGSSGTGLTLNSASQGLFASGVGVNTTSINSAYKLDVVGNVGINGTLSRVGTGNNIAFRYRTENSVSYSGGNSLTKFGRFYWTPGHWVDVGPVLKVTIQAKYYQGEQREYIIKAGYQDVDPQVNELQPSSSYQRITLELGATTAAGYNYSGQPVYYADLQWVTSSYVWGFAQVQSQVPFLTANPTSGWGGVVMDSSITQTNGSGTLYDYSSFFNGNLGVGTSYPVGHVAARKSIIVSDLVDGAIFEAHGSLSGKALLQSVGGDCYVGNLVKGNGTGNTYLTSGNGALSAVILNNGNFGIGATGPGEKLEVAGNLRIHNSSNAPYIDFVESGAVTDSKARITMDQVDTNNGTLIFSTEGSGTLSERMRITSAGNSFFNYSNSTIETFGSGVYGGKVVIKASGAEALSLLNNSIGGASQVALNFTNEFVANQYNFIARIIADPEQSWTSDAATRDAALSFFTSLNGSAGEKMRINSSGDVKIATHGKFLQGVRGTGNAVIDMIGFGAGTNTLQIKGGTSGGDNAISFFDTAGFIATFYNSNFGIGVTSPGVKLDVAGAIRTSDGLVVGATSTPNQGGISLDSGDLVLGPAVSIVVDDQPTASTASGSGTIVNWSVSEAVTAGDLYAIKTNGGWLQADADTENRATYMVAIALGTNATQGMLLQGFFYKSSHGFVLGAPLYISNTAGAFSNTRPTGSGDFVRIIGYATSANYIYFDPDKTFIKLQ